MRSQKARRLQYACGLSVHILPTRDGGTLTTVVFLTNCGLLQTVVRISVAGRGRPLGLVLAAEATLGVNVGFALYAVSQQFLPPYFACCATLVPLLNDKTKRLLCLRRYSSPLGVGSMYFGRNMEIPTYLWALFLQIPACAIVSA
jgi:hypothetical protein